ncbi:MAG: NapC/NirT family cytochrome c [bacterium]
MNQQHSIGNLLRNWVSLVGILAGVCALITGTVLMLIDLSGQHLSPYVGIIIYLVIPAIIAGSVLLVAAGMLWTHYRLRRQSYTFRLPVIDLGNRQTLARLALLGLLVMVCAVVSSVAAYRTYHFTESVEFCGQVCHQVMKPEYTAFRQSPHAGSSCTECHIGPGAGWFVKAKISGAYQVYSVAFNKYHRPIETPVQNLRPAKETCLTCHWPTKFFGAVLRTWTHYGADEKNSPWTIKMLLNIGGGNPAQGPIKGIHWHMEGVNTVEYVATDRKRLSIPWVRVTDQKGKVTVYRSEDPKARLSDAEMAKHSVRRMDCIDCHNRPSHQFRPPNELLDMALASGRIDDTIPSIKAQGAKLLAATYQTEAEALAAMDHELGARHPNDPRVNTTIRELQAIYSANFFPEMKVRWDEYPNHIGHKITPGCFRCHDGQHVSDSGKRISKDCTVCHTILAQGPGKILGEFTSSGLAFKHPEDIGDDWKTERCNTCHTD